MVARVVRDVQFTRAYRLDDQDITEIIESLPEPAEHEQAAQDAVIDCGDNSCIFKPSGAGGMRTNGGCRCYERAGFGASAVEAARKMLPEVLRLRREVSVAKREERERVTAIFLDEMQQAHEEQAAHPHAKCINLLEEQHLVNESLRAEIAAARAEGYARGKQDGMREEREMRTAGGRISIPTEAMEQEFATHERRGLARGRAEGARAERERWLRFYRSDEVVAELEAELRRAAQEPTPAELTRAVRNACAAHDAEHEQAAIDRDEVRQALIQMREWDQKVGTYGAAVRETVMDAAEAWLREHEQAAQDAFADTVKASIAKSYAMGLADGARAMNERCLRIAEDNLGSPASWIAARIRAAQDEPGGKDVCGSVKKRLLPGGEIAEFRCALAPHGSDKHHMGNGYLWDDEPVGKGE
jgi:hypothetical protein